MKNLLTILIVIIVAQTGFGQDIDSLGVNDDNHINKHEAIFLTNSLKNQKIEFDFENSKIAFSYGNYAKRTSKSDYFKKYIIPRIKNGESVGDIFYLFSKEEKLKSGGFDGVVLVWSKIGLTKRRRKVLVKELSKL
jgi:hypothetical protein